ncbi:hypothetical protein A6A27_18820 [Micromonospora sp. CB01531]|nr:hypothetical protein A6A27_18820 [Micromonospora sp. CB01531]
MLVGAAGESLHHLPVVGEVDEEEFAVDLAGVAAGGAVHGQHVLAHGAQVRDHGATEFAAGPGDDNAPGECGFENGIGHGHILSCGGPCRERGCGASGGAVADGVAVCLGDCLDAGTRPDVIGRWWAG